MKEIERISHTFDNGITVVNTTPHPLNFQDSVSGENVTIPTSVPEGERIGDFVVNASSNEVDLGGGLVTTEFVPSQEGLDRIEQIKDWASEEGKDVRIVGSMIAAQAYPEQVVGMVAAPGFERVPPQDKLMSVEKFTVFQNTQSDVDKDKLEAKVEVMQTKLEIMQQLPEDKRHAQTALEYPDYFTHEERQEMFDKIKKIDTIEEALVNKDFTKEEINQIKTEVFEGRYDKAVDIAEGNANDDIEQNSLVETLKEEGFNVKDYYESALVKLESGEDVLVETDNEGGFNVLKIDSITDGEIIPQVDGEGVEISVHVADIDGAIDVIKEFDAKDEVVKPDITYEEINDMPAGEKVAVLSEMSDEKFNEIYSDFYKNLPSDKQESYDKNLTREQDIDQTEEGELKGAIINENEEKEERSASLVEQLKEEGFDVIGTYESATVELDDGREIRVERVEDGFDVAVIKDIEDGKVIPEEDDYGNVLERHVDNADDMIDTVKEFGGIDPDEGVDIEGEDADIEKDISDDFSDPVDKE